MMEDLLVLFTLEIEMIGRSMSLDAEVGHHRSLKVPQKQRMVIDGTNLEGTNAAMIWMDVVYASKLHKDPFRSGIFADRGGMEAILASHKLALIENDTMVNQDFT